VANLCRRELLGSRAQNALFYPIPKPVPSVRLKAFTGGNRTWNICSSLASSWESQVCSGRLAFSITPLQGEFYKSSKRMQERSILKKSCYCVVEEEVPGSRHNIEKGFAL